MPSQGQHIPRAAIAAIAAAIPALARPGMAAFRAESPDASIRFVASATSPAMASGDCSVLAWFRWTGQQSGDSSIFTIPNRLAMVSTSSGGLVVTMPDGSGGAALQVVVPGALAPDEWTLLALSFDAASKELAAWTIGEDGLTHSDAIASATFDEASASAGPIIGADGLSPASPGVYATLALRGIPINAIDVQSAWALASAVSPFFIDASSSGGMTSGEGDVEWMTGHAMTTLPRNALTYPSGSALRAAIVGEPVTIYNVHAYQSFGAISGNTRVVRPVHEATDFLHVSPYDQDDSGFLTRRVPLLDPPLQDPAEVAAAAPRLRRAIDPAISGLSRIITTGNSRSQKRADGSGLSPGNYAHGFIGLDPARVAGVINRPPLDSRVPWFGLDATDTVPWSSGARENAEGTDFARFWTGSGSANGVAAGQGLILRPGSQFGMRCRPEGLIEATSPLIVRTHVLRFPGASGVTIWPNKHTQQGQPGTDLGTPIHLALDTTRASVTLDGVASLALSASALVLELNGQDVFVGDAITAGDAISLIETITPDSPSPGRTTVTLEHPLAHTPAIGATVRIGEWEHDSIDIHWDGLAPGDPDIWRGVRIEAAEPGDVGALLLGFSAWRPDADGVVWGVAGWGGNGYDTQIDQAFESAMRGWMSELAPDVWLQTFAQQDSDASSMGAIADMFQQTTPWADVVWVGEASHGGAHSEVWHEYILDNAGERGFVASTIVSHPDVGDLDEQIADGLRSDQSHFSQRGNERHAALWLDAFDRLAGAAPLPGDLNGDGAVTFTDLNMVLTNFGQTSVGIVGDANYDNEVGFSDLNIVLTNFGSFLLP